MLLVNAFAGPSQIHGTGLIAREPIPAGTPIWTLHPGFDVELSRDEFGNLAVWSREQIRKYVYVDVATGKYVLCSDDAKFMNHSSAPNTRTEGDRTWAIRDIAPGDELTCDYAEFDMATRKALAAAESGPAESPRRGDRRDTARAPQ
jgi:SET domain-containing protein